MPEIILEDVNEEVYLERGVSAKIVVMPDGQKALLGTKSMIEGWTVVSSWILIPETKNTMLCQKAP